ncbi:MAG: Ig-like domain-containing protein [Lachnospiraceae bacterium]|nr:Ig-like domain-containing protein [Lachnospiraceae bacterium]
MGRSKKLYQAKRLLALILAVVMSVTMIPVTAYAAPADNGVQENDPALTAESQGDGQTDETESNTADMEAVADENKMGADNLDVEKGANTDPQEKQQGTPKADVAKPVYTIVTDKLKTQAVYTGAPVFDLSAVRLQRTLNGQTEEVDAAMVTSVWKMQGADGTYAAMAAGAEPVAAGSYEAVFSFAKEEGIHDGAEATVRFEIAKASVTVQVKAVTVKPGTAKKDVKVEAEQVMTDPATSDNLNADDVRLTITGIRDAMSGTAVGDDEKLMKNADYVLDIKSEFNPEAAEARKAVYVNYNMPETFTADVVMGELIGTQVKLTLSDAWKENGAVTLKAYDGKPANAPAVDQDYTCEVQYLSQNGYVKLDNAQVEGSWVAYSEDCLDEKGTVVAPVDAGTYSYRLTYKGQTGEYAESYVDIPVVIDQAKAVIEITNTKPVKAVANTPLREVLSEVTYKVYRSEGDKQTELDITKEHIWGTGYDDSNVSQIYEPLFILQMKDGELYKDIVDADHRLLGGKEYRIIYNGKKAIYNANGTYSHRTDINAGLDVNGEEINGMNPNYITDETPTADAKALVVEVEDGVKAELDITKLLGDGKAGETPETAMAKEYDGQYLYNDRSDYKSGVFLKASGKTFPAVGEEFTYTWYRNAAEDLLDKQIWDENRTNGFTGTDARDFDNSWNRMNGFTPRDAGIYKLEIDYKDKTDDGTYYYIEKPAVVYYVINRRQIKVVPTGTFETFSGHTIGRFFQNREISRDDYTVSGLLDRWDAFVEWQVNEQITADPQNPVENTYYEYDENNTFKSAEEKASYTLQAYEIYVYADYDNEISDNFTWHESKVTHVEEGGKQRVVRDEKSLNETAAINVKAIGTTKLTVTAVDMARILEKVYDGEAFGADEANALVKVTQAEGGQEVPASDLKLVYRFELKDNGESSLIEYTKDAGEYNIYAGFEGDEKYAPLENEVLAGTAKITKRPLTLSLDTAFPESYTAGARAYEVIEDVRGNITVSGYVQKEAQAFQRYYSSEGYVFDAWSEGPSFLLYEKGTKTPLNDGDILHRNKGFDVYYDFGNSLLSDDCWIYDPGSDEDRFIDVARNYEVTSTEALAGFTTVTGSSSVAAYERPQGRRFAMANPDIVVDNNGNITQTIKILEGIGYSRYNLKGETLKGNLVAFKISVPPEFDGVIPDTAMYENEVEKNGGYVVSSYKGDGYFTILVDAREGSRTIKVRWEDKYYETFVLQFDEKQLLGNLLDAVAPKSLFFNAPSKKMAVGSVQQLDVKIKKAQMGDVISLGYKSSDDKILRVNENGQVTALKKGKATITVYAQHLDEKADDNEMVPIMDASGTKYAKSATVVIDATSLTAPKPVKVTAHGVYADLNYSTPKDGYRREIYVVDNKKNPTLKKAADIEKAVQSMKDGQWKDTFAIAPVYQDSADENLNQTRYEYTVRLTGLQPQGQYTVYVRNVCAARTLEDGSVVSQSTVNESAAGTAAGFKTLKAENLAIHLMITDRSRNDQSQVQGIEDLGQRLDSDYEEIDGHRFLIELSKLAKGSVDCQVYGEFALNAKDPSYESGDRMMRPLPLSDRSYFNYYDKDDKNYYEEPKLEYALSSNYNKETGAGDWSQKIEFASIDKKGKIKITGVTGRSSYFTGRVKDTVTGHVTYAELYVVADVDSVTAKKKSIKMTVGKSVRLNDTSLYTYNLGKKKLTGYRWPNMVSGDEVAAAIKAQNQEKFFTTDGYGSLRAIEAGGKLELTLTDKTVLANNGGNKDRATVNITFSSTALAPVKKLKAYDVIHDRFGLTFTYADEEFVNSSDAAFRVQITDASGKKLCDKLYQAEDIYNWKEKIYRIIPGNLPVKLSKESQYKVSVTAMYDDVASREATVKVKTTKIPACVNYIGDKEFGGMTVQVSEGNKTLSKSSPNLTVLSGNSYTLTANIELNRGRVNDTLTWMVSDGKTASVKAAAGSYCITLKGLKPGDTRLEVKSRILGNKVIARYRINVVAVGDAYKDSNRYYGDNEPENWENVYLDNGGDGAPEYLPLSVGDLRKVTQIRSTDEKDEGYSLFGFTVPETGRYRFSALGYNTKYTTIGLYKGTDKRNLPSTYIGDDSADLGWLTEGDTVYLRSSYTYSIGYRLTNSAYYVGVELTQRVQSMDTAGTMKIEGQDGYEFVKFTAAENGYHQFTMADEWNQNIDLYLYTDEQSAIRGNGYGNAVDEGNKIERLMQKGDSVWLSAYLRDNREYTFSAEKVSEEMTLGASVPVTLKANGTKYLMLSVDKNGYYKFSSTADTADSNVYAKMLVNGVDDYANTAMSSVFEMKKELRQGDSVCLMIQNNGSTEVSITVKAEDITPDDLPEGSAGDIKITADDVFYKFTAPAAGAYEFQMTADTSDSSVLSLKIWNDMNDISSGLPLAMSGMPIVISGTDPSGASTSKAIYRVGISLLEGQTVYLNPVNESGSEMTVSINGGKKNMPELQAGETENIVNIQESDAAYNCAFTAPASGIYTFTWNREVRIRLYQNGVYNAKDNPGEDVILNNGAKDLLMMAGQTIVWSVSAEQPGEVSIGVVMKDELKELQTGKAATASYTGSGSISGGSATADGFIFMAPSSGYYTFWAEGSEDNCGWLFDIARVDPETCLVYNKEFESGQLAYSDDDGIGNNFAIVKNLVKGQIVYLKISGYYNNTSDSFLVYVEAGQKTFHG